MAQIRRRAIREWSCPNHPEGPVTLPAEGYECEELTIAEAYGDAFVATLRRLCEAGGKDGEEIGRTLGLCCVGQEWKTTGYETVEIGHYESFLYSLGRPLMSPPTLLLSELVRGDE